MGITRRVFGEEAGDRSVLGFDFTAESWEGSGSMVGITELGDVSDPPRKYRRLESSYAAPARTDAALTPATARYSWLNRALYNTAGVKTQTPAAPDGANGSASSIALLAPANSYESIDWTADWLPYVPTWTRAKTSKLFTTAELPASPGESARTLFWYQQNFGRVGGVVGTSRGLSLGMPVWAGDHWTVQLTIGGDGTNIGTAPAIRVYARLGTGNIDPGVPALTDPLVAYAPALPALSGGPTATVTLALPPDVSMRLLLVRDPVSGMAVPCQCPQQYDELYTNGSPGASGLTEGPFDRWFHLPATSGELPAWRYEERLTDEDTMEDALVRAGVVMANEFTAFTTALAGGLTAESTSPITFSGRTVRITKTFSGRTAGVIYRYTFTLVTNTIGLTDYVVSTVDVDREATAATEVVTRLLEAPLGMELRCVALTDATLGPGPVPPPSFDSAVVVWWGKVLAAGGSILSTDLTIANNLTTALKGLGVWPSIRYMLPLLGQDLAAALVPLQDARPAGAGSYGAVTNTNFVDADFNPAAGLQGNATNKILALPFTAADLDGLGTSRGGGCYWETNVPGAFTAAAWGYNSGPGLGIYALILSTTEQAGRWGAFANQAAVGGPAPNGCFHVVRASSTSRVLYRDGVALASNATADGAPNANGHVLMLLGDFLTPSGNRYYGGRCGFAAFDNGLISAPDVALMYAAIRDNLMLPTGRTV